MRVLIVEPGQYARVAEIDHTLEAEQAVVGGMIEVVYPWNNDKAAIVCNDEGLINGMPLNRAVENYEAIAGPFFVCGLTEDDFCGLTDAQVKRYDGLYHNPQLFYRTPEGIKARSCSPEVYDLLQNGGAPKKPKPPRHNTAPER